ncbi:MAG: DUF3179 domain-containing protein [Rhodospirillaceae bacterium]|nr:DUF3179 domain-containing protein [Rhodospirillaceae bacterium]MBT6430840.1 DUF3179 domain-containing protein [Rhodospirillaceae bacterium]MBT7666899.1 DUF3179 domain-containing protein [Rhodospirillaceae bacterium]MBT7760967.1 DUF3179 domain-containing protein [Rhodospirillaceae bacterium]
MWRIGIPLICLLFFLTPVSVRAAHTLGADPVTQAANDVMYGSAEKAREALAFMRKRGKRDVVAGLILSLQFNRRSDEPILETLKALTGHDAHTWHLWMLWQEANGEPRPHASFAGLMLQNLSRIDKRFGVFFRSRWSKPSSMRIRMEEIVWGGVGAVTGIPSLDRPHMQPAAAADYLRDDDLVFGVEINGDTRAYPLRIMGWHEMLNDTIGGVPVALAYCTLCGSGILYETLLRGRVGLPGRGKPFEFGSSGLLYRSNKLMFDWETMSLWNQFTGEPVAGPLAKSRIRLRTRPVVITTWAQWHLRNPATTVLALDTGHDRYYGSGVVYRDYFASPNLMFPAVVQLDAPLKQKDYVFGIQSFGVTRAWPLAVFAKRPIINDKIGKRRIVLIGDAATRTVRAYDRMKPKFSFKAHEEPGFLEGLGGKWAITEAALIGPRGEKLPRIAGHVAYWFAWENYRGPKATLYEDR